MFGHAARRVAEKKRTKNDEMPSIKRKEEKEEEEGVYGLLIKLMEGE